MFPIRIRVRVGRCAISMLPKLMCYCSQEGDAPPGLCACHELSKCYPTADTPQPSRLLYNGVDTPFVTGNVTPPVVRNADQLSTVVFTELYTFVARSDLRLHFRHLQMGAFTGMDATSNVFKISAGRLQRLSVVRDPSTVSSKAQIPE